MISSEAFLGDNCHKLLVLVSPLIVPQDLSVVAILQRVVEPLGLLEQGQSRLGAEKEHRAAEELGFDVGRPRLNPPTLPLTRFLPGSNDRIMRSQKVNTDEARERLSDLITAASEGGEVIIVRDNKPVARLVPATDATAYKSLNIAD